MTPSPPDQHETTRHEDELRDLLVRGMSRTTAPIALGDHALAAGRRLRARRRLAFAAGAVAACSVLALAAPLALGGATGTGGATQVDPVGRAGTATEQPTAEQPTAEPPTTEQSAPETPGWWAMPASDMLDVVRAVVPQGVAVTASGPLQADTEEGGPARGYIVPQLAGPTGPGQLNVMLYPELPGDTGTDGDLACPSAADRRGECAELRTADGTLEGHRSSSTAGEVTILEVVLRRDGGTVYAATANTLDRKWGRLSPASAGAPPLDLDQLEALAREEAWAAHRP